MKMIKDIALLILCVCAFMVVLGMGLKFYWNLFLFGWGLV